MAAIRSAWDDGLKPSSENETVKLARKLDKQIRSYVGRVDEDELDRLEFEEEIETFERIKRKR